MTGPMLAEDMGLSRRLLPAPAIPIPGLLIGGAVGLLAVAVLGLVGAGLGHEHVAPAQPLLAPGTLGHPLGTDQLGRDVLARTLAGFGWSLAVVLPATVIAGLLGTGLGLATATNRGWTQAILERATETAAGFPFLVLAASDRARHPLVCALRAGGLRGDLGRPGPSTARSRSPWCQRGAAGCRSFH